MPVCARPNASRPERARSRLILVRRMEIRFSLPWRSTPFFSLQNFVAPDFSQETALLQLFGKTIIEDLAGFPSYLGAVLTGRLDGRCHSAGRHRYPPVDE